MRRPGAVIVLVVAIVTCIEFFMVYTRLSVPKAVFKMKAEAIFPRMFDPSQPSRLLVLSYQRCGSSFFGGLFDRHPQGFYAYEPLDGLYTAMYGINEGWNVPGDIMNYQNGTIRVPPVDETDAVSKYLTNLLKCQSKEIPVESLLHKFWSYFPKNQNSLKRFIECSKSLPNLKDCQKHISKRCHGQFKLPNAKSSVCHNILWNSQDTRPRRGFHTQSVPDEFKKYDKCLKDASGKAMGCATVFQSLCLNAKLRAVKTVRATMDSVEALVKRVPNFRAIHLIRDPRAVVLSRRKFGPSGQSSYAKGDIVKEAKVYCQNVVRDILLRHQLERQYPGTFMEVIYDDFVRQPLKHTDRIYGFINLTLPAEVGKWVNLNTQQQKNASKIASKWQTELKFTDVLKINNVCKDLYETLQSEMDESLNSIWRGSQY